MALSCNLTRDILKTSSCGYSLESVSDIYLANYSDVTASTVADVSGCSYITTIGLAQSAEFYHIEPAKDSASFTDELVVADNGAKYRTHTLTFTLSNAFDGCLKDDVDALSLGRYFAVVKTASGNYIALGRTVGLEAETATVNGSSETNGIEVVMSANVAESVTPLDEAAIAVVIG